MICADTVFDPPIPRTDTTKFGLCPVASIDRADRVTDPEVIGTLRQPGISTPSEFSTVNVALV